MWTYNDLEELYHWGILGMKWGHRKNKYQNNKEQKTKKQKWSTKKKFLVGAAVATSILGGVIGAKKIKSYINRENSKVADHFANKIIAKNGWNKTSFKKASEIKNIVNNQSMKYKIKNVMKYKFNPRYPYK